MTIKIFLFLFFFLSFRTTINLYIFVRKRQTCSNKKSTFISDFKDSCCIRTKWAHNVAVNPLSYFIWKTVYCYFRVIRYLFFLSLHISIHADPCSTFNIVNIEDVSRIYLYTFVIIVHPKMKWMPRRLQRSEHI